MKRYRIMQFDFDTRVCLLTLEINEEWDSHVKELHKANKVRIYEELISMYGGINTEVKVQNFIDLGVKQPSILAFHNSFLEQIRNSFIIGSYYPALTGACALGERILNHLIITLRDYYKDREEYKKIYRKASFDDRDKVIDMLESWQVLLPETVVKFRELKTIRNSAIHFNPEVDTNDRALALNAITCLQDVINNQFSIFGPKPRLIFSPGEVYIKKEWATIPFIEKIYIPNCVHVGWAHTVKSLNPLQIEDHQYEDKEISDEEFVAFRGANKA